MPTDSLRLLPCDVQAFEPHLALDGGADGTDVLAEIARKSLIEGALDSAGDIVGAAFK